MLNPSDTLEFDEVQPKLLGIAYRILGSMTDAEDAVQDTFLKWAQANRDVIENPASWMVKTCTHRCLDLLRDANRSRVDYIGEWLPEPVQKTLLEDADSHVDLAISLKTAFLLMLDRLTPKERAAYLLHDIFDMSYEDVSNILGMKQNSCRKLVSRAKANIDQSRVRFKTPLEQQNRLLQAFQIAVSEGSTQTLSELLSMEIKLTADGGGKVPTIMETLTGKSDVTSFLTIDLRHYWKDYQWEIVDINGERGFVLNHNGKTEAVVSFAYDTVGRATDIFIIRNPEKLTSLSGVSIH